jgi:hypothetical protein
MESRLVRNEQAGEGKLGFWIVHGLSPGIVIRGMKLNPGLEKMFQSSDLPWPPFFL